MAYTKGPWTNRNNQFQIETYGTASIIGADKRGICAIATSIDRPACENRANALLIQAAPDLLSSALALIDQIRGSWVVPSDRAGDALNDMLAAIAKAEGRN